MKEKQIIYSTKGKTVEENNKNILQDNLCNELNQLKEENKRLKQHINNLEQMCQICSKEQENEQLKQHSEWVMEFIERYKIDIGSIPEYSQNPIIEYCMQIEDCRACDSAENKSWEQQFITCEESAKKQIDIILKYFDFLRVDDESSYPADSITSLLNYERYLINENQKKFVLYGEENENS